jgi:3-dehydroquinate synthase
MISFLDHDFTNLNRYIKSQSFSKIFILCDENTHEYCLPTLLGNLEINIPFEIIEIEPGEEMKTIETVVQLWEILAELQADRKSLLINLGGGMITDLGGFVASTYKRGISFIHLPTTLLGICDASIGGKTGIDHGFVKNLVGTFATPKDIFVYPNFLKTLPFGEIRSGFAEMLKHGLVADAKHWEELQSVDLENTEEMFPYLETSMQIKQTIVKSDYKEIGIRKILNFGHTYGHAIESLFLTLQKPIPHGEAVAIGMILETKLAAIESLIPEKLSDEIILAIQQFYPYISIDKFKDEEIISLMKNDKKNESENFNFSLISAIGKGEFNVQSNKANILKALAFYRNLG